MIGETISRYRIVSHLGSGAMGDVYRAEDLRLGRPVALKLIRTAGDAQDASRRLLAEARAASALTHPNIAVVYEVDEVKDRGGHLGFIAMEYVSGRVHAGARADRTGVRGASKGRPLPPVDRGRHLKLHLQQTNHGEPLSFGRFR
jgi:hypothetical protein